MTLESLVRSGNSRTNTALLNRLMGSQIAFLLSRSQAVKQNKNLQRFVELHGGLPVHLATGWNGARKLY
jgi:hypothetical protein